LAAPTLDLPFHGGDSSIAKRTEEPMNPRILVVDDEATVRHLVAGALRRRGFEVVEAENGMQALRAVDVPGVRLMLSDVEMPGMDGYALAEIVQSRHPECGILLMSSRISGDRARAYPFLQKPFMPSQLMERVVEAMQGNRSVRID
jgi:DNA-binding NtrC family response regulator